MAPSLFSALFPPSPTFTDANLPSLSGKVYIITGAASGVGYRLAKMLYAKGGKVYIAARSTARCSGAIEKIKGEVGGKGIGKLEAMVVDLADLRTVKGAAEGFLAKEERLDVLWHNAGVMTPPKGSLDKQGHDLEMGTNALAPYLLTQFLEPILIRSAVGLPFGSVRIVWVVTLMQAFTLLHGPAGAMSFDSIGAPKVLPVGMDNYMHSKTGELWLSVEYAKRLGDKGILSVSVYPGIMKTELQRNMPAPARLIIGLLLKPAIYGAYSELFAGFSPDITREKNGCYIAAWGSFGHLSDDIAAGLKSEAEGGSGKAKIFLNYCDRQVKEFLV